ncbi:uncharacterized protein LOC117590716 [Drosophila guanche]|uniref:uncharacterized protein LOC117590716 n=1 Tax=Drosophila guanche TaxID=7266 RepID=UPI001471D783|nr:uncharacterized protein LOC117590716 [Drosophila guanche]
MTSCFNISSLNQLWPVEPRLLTQSILFVVMDGRGPMTDTEIIASVGDRHHRSDPDFKRQVRELLREIVSLGSLRRKQNLYLLPGQRLSKQHRAQ